MKCSHSDLPSMSWAWKKEILQASFQRNENGWSLVCMADPQVPGSREYRERGEILRSWHVPVSYDMALLVSRSVGDAEQD